MNKSYVVLFLLIMAVSVIGCERKTADIPDPASDTALFEQETTITEDELAAAGSQMPVSGAQTMTGLEGAASTPAELASPIEETPSEVMTASASIAPTVKEIQTALKNLGLYQEEIDGALGPKTKRAIREFQAQNNLKVDGKVGPKTWKKLSVYLNQQTDEASSLETSN